MIDELDRSLERWLRAAVPLRSDQAEISFDPPEREWESRRSTPLLDLFLYELQPSRSRAATGSRIVPREGGLAREQVVPVIAARYLISVWGGGPAVEHDLLGRVVNLLAASRTVPQEFLSEPLRAARPGVTLSLAPDQTTSAPALWGSLSIPPRPAIQLLVESPVALPVPRPVADPPTSLQLTAGDRYVPAARSQRRRTFGRLAPGVGGAAAGSGRVQDSGRGGDTRSVPGETDGG